MTKHYTRPQIGCAVYATPSNPSYKPGDFIGTVKSIEGNICIFTRPNGDIDRFIWRFKDGLNTFHTYGA